MDCVGPKQIFPLDSETTRVWKHLYIVLSDCSLVWYSQWWRCFRLHYTEHFAIVCPAQRSIL